MPLLYGEGEKAFLRLQQEIIRQTDDESIFAWCDPKAAIGQMSGVLAPTIYQFARSSHVHVIDGYRKPYAVTNKGLDFDVPCLEVSKLGVYIVPLNCEYRLETGSFARCAIAVQETRDQFSTSSRIHTDGLGDHLLNIHPWEERFLTERRFLIRLSNLQKEYEQAVAVISNFLERRRSKKIERLVEQLRSASSIPAERARYSAIGD